MLTKKSTTKKKRKSYAAASIPLMSSEHKLLLLANSTITESDATNNKHCVINCQQTPHCNCSSGSNRSQSSSPSSSSSWLSSTATTKSRRHHCTYDNDGAVKPKSIVLTNNLVNSLMTLLYFIAFVAISTYPVHVSAVAPKYETAYACEEKTLTIGCEPGYLINLIRANYGRFSITICNDHGNVDWSVNCMSAKSLRVLYSRCSHKQNCSVLASTNMFGDPCAGTHKYLEAHYQCVSESQTTSTTTRPSPPWLITSQPSVWGTSTIRNPTTARISLSELEAVATAGGGGSSSSVVNRTISNNSSNKSSSNNDSINNNNNKTYSISNTANRKTVTKLKSTATKNAATTNTTTISPKLQSTKNNASIIDNGTKDDGPNNNRNNENASVAAVTKSTDSGNGSLSSSSSSSSSSSTTLKNVADQSTADGGLLESKQIHKSPTQSTVSSSNGVGTYDDSNALYCGPTTARNLFWNFTRVGDINVQPCPGGATGIAKWRCAPSDRLITSDAINSVANNKNRHIGDDEDANNRVAWQPVTPDLTQCRSLWLNSLEVRVQQRESSVVSISNELSQVTNSKTLYGGDMLVTTKIIQMMSEKMTYDIETYPDQKLREGIVSELLNGVVKTGSNLLDETQHLSWLDLSFEDQMRVATALLTGLEDNAFLLAATIARERNVVQKVKNILISVRVLETRNIVGNEVFPDANIEQWQVSEDSIELPRGALIENSESGLVRIVFVAFDRLESILKPLDTTAADQKQYGLSDASYSVVNTSHGQPAQPARVRILNSKVISASLGKGRHIQLSQPIRLVLKHLMVDNVTNPSCVFWNYIDHAWSEDGCRIDQTNRTHTICMCNHLTNFAILMDVIDDTAQFIQQIGVFDENIRLLISISIAICIIFIIIALLTLKLFNGIFVKVRAQRNTQPLQTISNIRENMNCHNSQTSRQTINNNPIDYHHHQHQHHNNRHANNNNSVNVMNQSPVRGTQSATATSILSNNDCISSFSNSNLQDRDRINLQRHNHHQQLLQQQQQQHQQHEPHYQYGHQYASAAENTNINSAIGNSTNLNNQHINNNSNNLKFNTRSHNHTGRNLNSIHNSSSGVAVASNVLHLSNNSGNLVNNVSFVRDVGGMNSAIGDGVVSLVRMNGSTINNNLNPPNIQSHHHHLHHTHHPT